MLRNYNYTMELRKQLAELPSSQGTRRGPPHPDLAALSHPALQGGEQGRNRPGLESVHTT